MSVLTKLLREQVDKAKKVISEGQKTEEAEPKEGNPIQNPGRETHTSR